MIELSSFTSKEIEEYRKLFLSFESDNMGWVHTSNLSKLFFCVSNYHINKTKKLIKEFDPDDQGMIDFSTFLNMLSRHDELIKAKREANEVFDILDTDGDEFVLITQFKNIVLAEFPNLDKSQIYSMFDCILKYTDYYSKTSFIRDYLYLVNNYKKDSL